MATITTSDGTQIFYKDWGSGQPVVFSHGWPLNADAWDDQAMLVADNGYRAIAHDRRAHGRSSQPWTCATPCWWATPPAAARSPATSAATAATGLPSWCCWGRSPR